MGFQAMYLKFSITREQFADLLLLDGSLNLEDGEEHFSLTGARYHKKFGEAGVEDGGNHFFTTSVLHNERYSQGAVSLKSTDGGKIYQGTVSFGTDKIKSDEEQVEVRARQMFIDMPTSEFSEFSQKLLHEDPLEWVATKARAIRAVLLTDDKDGLAILKDDVAHVVGNFRAEWFILGIMEKIVAQTNHPD